MPQWRKTHYKITESIDFNAMPDDFTRLVWILLPLGLDREGRGIYNPAWIKAKIMPLRLDVDYQQVADSMEWFRSKQMIIIYNRCGTDYFMVPTFRKYQGSTVKEAQSTLPAPTIEELTNSGLTPDLIRSWSSTDVGVDSDADVDSDIDSDVDADREIPATELLSYSTAFAEETGLPDPGYKDAGLREIYRAGASIDDFRTAIQEQIQAARNGKPYKLDTPGSFVRATLNVMARRKGKASSNGSRKKRILKGADGRIIEVEE